MPERTAPLRFAEPVPKNGAVRSPYGFDMCESCTTCAHRGEYIFCNLSQPALESFEKIRSTAVYPKGAILFVEGQDPRGIFVLCHGRAKLTTSSAEGKTIILRVAEPGEVLGLSATLSGKPYEVTAETLEPSEANFVSREPFIDFLRDQGEAALNVARELSNHYHCAYREVRTLGLSGSASARVARLLLDWVVDNGNSNELHLRLTHEEISQLIGTSRETVTRTLATLKKKQIIQVRGAKVVILKRDALANLANS